MEEINTEVKLNQQYSKQVMISILLSNGYNQDFRQWVRTSWQQMNHDSGKYWDIIVPSTKFSHGEIEPIGDFELELTERLIDLYQIDRNQLPCIVFDDFQEDRRQRFISMNSLNEETRTQIFIRISSYFSSELENIENFPIENRRAEIIDGLMGELNKQAIIKRTLGLAPAAVSAGARALRWGLAGN